MITARDIQFRYGHRKVLDGVDLDLKSGELVTLLGRNGEGKSTLFRILTGEMQPNQGIVEFDGIDLYSLDWKELARRRSVLPQESAISFPLRVSEVVEMGRAPHKKNKSEDKDYAAKAMQLTDVMHLENRFYSDLSGGEKKRVQIARVLCQLEKDSGMLFLDEPVNALDVLLQHKIMKILRHLADVGYTVFCILHDWNLAGLYSDRVMVLEGGKLREDGSPGNVIRQDILSDVFGIHANIFRHGEKRVGGYSESLT